VFSPFRIDLGMLSMVLSVLRIKGRQFLIMDNQQILGIVLLGSLCEIERPCNDGLLINDDIFCS
jgi:hypothetical protein